MSRARGPAAGAAPEASRPAGPFSRLPTDLTRPRPARANGSSMLHPEQIENIEELRRREGIDDVELREEVRGLGVGDVVMLTFLTGTNSFAGETLPVRITS